MNFIMRFLYAIVTVSVVEPNFLHSVVASNTLNTCILFKVFTVTIYSESCREISCVSVFKVSEVVSVSIIRGYYDEKYILSIFMHNISFFRAHTAWRTVTSYNLEEKFGGFRLRDVNV
jgi:hypothetical protein